MPACWCSVAAVPRDERRLVLVGGKAPRDLDPGLAAHVRPLHQDRGLNNLLWVYGPNHGKKTADYYAGDGNVDIVGLDVYTDFVDPRHILGYPEAARLPKPFGFTEFGPHGPQNPPG